MRNGCGGDERNIPKPDISYALDGDTNTEGVQPFDLSFGNGTISMFMVYTVFAP